MIYDGLIVDTVEDYLLQRAWLQDAARFLDNDAQDLDDELVTSMSNRGAVVVIGGRRRAAAPHPGVDQGTLDVPYPKDWS